MQIISRLSLVVLVSLIFACSNNSKKDVQNVKFSFDKSSTILEWTAFKFTEKKGVKGTFDAVTYTSVGEANTAEELVKSLTFSIDVASVNTDNPERDAKINQLFFGSMKDATIKGKVLELLPNEKAKIQLELNGKRLDVPATYLLDQGSFVLESKIDVTAFGMSTGIEQLNAACKELHTGADGVSKLWSEVDLYFSTELKVTSITNSN